MTVTKQWQELLAQMSWADLSGDEVEAGKRLLIDALGIASAGAQAEGVSGTLAALAQLGTGTVPVPWAGVDLPPAQAGLALSALIHAWDFDDTHDQAVVHTLAVALPAAVAAGAHAGRSGADILNGVVVGVQVLSRLSLLLGGQRGMIRTAGLGSIAAAAAAARTLGLDGEGIGNAMALALPASGSPSSRQVVEDSAVSKRLQPGLGVQAGVTAAFLAQNGVAGPHGWLEGSFGLFALAGEQGLGLYTLLASGWEGANVSLKPYPACRYTHAAIAAAAEISERLGSAAEIATVDVHVPNGPAYELVSRPFARRGLAIVDAQFSIPWLVAAQFVTGHVDLTTLAGPTLLDPAVEELAARIVAHQDRRTKTAMTPATVVVHTTEGVDLEATAPMIGSPEHPLTLEAIAAKLAACAEVGGHDSTLGTRVRTFVEGLAAIPVSGVATELSTLCDFGRITTPNQEKTWTSV